MTKRFYLTTAIDYVNGQPHLGHAYEKVITDVIARAHRSLGEEVFFLTGVDEHGQKVQQTALDQGKTPQDYCDDLVVLWRAMTQRLNLGLDDFVRTSEPRHREFVQALLRRLHAQGHFYKAKYHGFYSAKEETFLTEKDRRPDGTFDPFYGAVVELEEDDYYFRLKDHQRWLIDYIEGNDLDPNDAPGRAARERFIQPDYRRNEVLGFLRHQELEDLCISRPVARLNWGIPLPFAPEFVTYVWFDALVNYASVPAFHGDPVVRQAVGLETAPPGPPVSLWPADIHVIGKDIAIFHAVYWPIMLKAAGLPLPRQILIHGWWQKDGQKMSKTTGNVVDPIAVIDEWGVDAFRYFVVRELDIGADGNWTDAGFRARYSAELANGLGNLLNRSLSMLHRYRQGVVPARDDDLAATAAGRIGEAIDHLREHHLQAALVSIWDLVNLANQYVDRTAPFKLAKDPSQGARLDQVLYNLAEVCRILAVLLWPFLPQTSERIFRQLGFDTAPDRLAAARWGLLEPGHRIGQPEVLFPRKDLAAPATERRVHHE